MTTPSNPRPLSRRALLGLGAGTVGAAALTAAGCGPAGDPGVGAPGAGGSGGGLTWWDHNVNLQQPNRVVWDAWTARSGVPVEYTYQQAGKIGQALQLAKQSGQTPDVHSNAGLEQTLPALIADGWFAPVEWDEQVRASFGEDALVPGLHVFDDAVYTFPIFADRQYTAATWFNTEMVARADLDPLQPPATYDDFRAALRTVAAANEGASGWIWNLGQPDRLADQLNFLAQAAGFEGFDGTRYATGEVAYHDDAYVTVLEFLLSLQQDGLLFPASSTLDDQTARVRWAAGGAAYFTDGPWCSGTVQTEIPEFLPQVGVGQMLRPDAGSELVAYRGPSGGNYFVSANSQRPAEVADLLAGFGTAEYWTGIANAMAQPPYDTSVVAGSSAVEPWKRLVGLFEEQVRLAPTAILRTPDIAVVQRFQTTPTPGLGEIVQGAFSGDVTDVRGELKRLSDAVLADREQAVEQARQEGAQVELADWGFDDWTPGTDYDTANYTR